MHSQTRRSFKTPPISDRESSQNARRSKALEEQKRKRAQRVDSSRNLDEFASLSLGQDDDDTGDGPEIIQDGVAHLASLLSPQSTSSTVPPSSAHDKPRKARKPNAHFANKIMYAELLEMKDDPILLGDEETTDFESDGLPPDLETNWVALAPVPQGKRCLAVSNQSSNVPGTVSNTFLKSRLKGRTILTFPSPLPPGTILDCILDDAWKYNGIIHVLDIVRWKGQEIGECEANFRFWWRDTRLSEIISLPSSLHPSFVSGVTSFPGARDTVQQIFSYPNTFLPIPYHMDLTYPVLLSTIIPHSRTFRHIDIRLPSHSASSDGGMEVDYNQDSVMPLDTTVTEIRPDGLLLYLSQASYEPGTSPLSSWVPIKSYTEGQESPLALFERLIMRRISALKKQSVVGTYILAMEE